jgi:signal transduction histidine kinase
MRPQAFEEILLYTFLYLWTILLITTYVSSIILVGKMLGITFRAEGEIEIGNFAGNSISRQFVLWMVLFTSFILINSIAVYLYQNNVLSVHQVKEDQFKNKLKLAVKMEASFNKLLFEVRGTDTLREETFKQLRDDQNLILDGLLSQFILLDNMDRDRTFLADLSRFHDYYFKHLFPSTFNYEEIQQMFIGYYDYLAKDMEIENQEFNSEKSMVKLIVIIFMIISLATMILIIRTWVNKLGLPLRELARAANQLSAGEREVTINLLHRKDELGVLSGAFTKMITSIRKAEGSIHLLNSELMEKNTDLEQIVYVASHDLRSPLVNIQGFSKELDTTFKFIHSTLKSENDIFILRQKLIILFEEEIPEALGFIESSTNKMDMLLTGLLRLSRLGRGSLSLKPLDMNALVSEVVSNFEYQIKELKVRLDISELPQCHGDQNLINQVFSNLLDNAIKSLVPGRQGLIRFYGYLEDGLAVYWIEDNGIGISKEYQNKIFDLFEKIDINKKGEGLGLTIVRKIVDRHKGHIRVESEPDTGSKFGISLPAQASITQKNLDDYQEK